MTKLQRAAQAAGAVRIGRNAWVHYDDATRRWWQVTSDNLRDLCTYLDSESDQRDAYSLWCRGTVAMAMPEGWEPGQ